MKSILQQLEQDLYKLNPDQKDPEAWVTRDNRVIHISSLDDSHLLHILLYLRKRMWHILHGLPDNWRELIPAKWKARFDNLEKEMLKRGHSNWESMRVNQLEPVIAKLHDN